MKKFFTFLSTFFFFLFVQSFVVAAAVSPEALQKFEVNPSSNVAGEANVECTFTLKLPNEVSLKKGSRLKFYFPAGMITKEVVPAGAITVNGQATTVDCKGNGVTLIDVVTPIDLNANEDITVVFLGGEGGAGLSNPLPGSRSFVFIATNVAKSTTTYNYVAQPISELSMTVSSEQAGEQNVEYVFSFQTSPFGKLREGQYIYVYAPKGVFTQDVITAGSVLVNGVPTKLDGVVSRGMTARIPVPVSIDGDSRVDVTFLGGDNGARLRNPGFGMKRFIVWTQMNERETVYYTFTGVPVEYFQVSSSSAQAGEISEYAFRFSTSKYGALNAGDVLNIYAPPGVFQKLISQGTVFVNGVAVTESLSPVNDTILKQY